MARLEALSDPLKLRRRIRDLVALSTPLAIWKNYDPIQISESVAAVLVPMISADFVYVLIPKRQGESSVEILRSSEAIASGSLDRIRAILRTELPARAPQRQWTIADPGGEGLLRLACAPIGFGVDAVVVAGSGHAEFPTESQLLLLTIAANEVTIASQRWQAAADKRCIISLIERSSDFIGISTPGGALQYINSSGLRYLGVNGMELGSRLSMFDLIIPEERDRVRDELWPIVMQDGHWSGEIKFRHFMSQGTIPFLVEWFRIDDPHTGHPTNIATTGRDLTSRKRADSASLDQAEMLKQLATQLTEANQRLVVETTERQRAEAHLQLLQLEFFHAARLNAAGQMAAALAHELHQPLTAVGNSVNAARRLIQRDERLANSKVSEVMSEAIEQTLRTGKIIQRLHDFLARGETEKRVEEVAPMIEDACGLALMGLQTLGLKVRFRFDRAMACVLVDRIQIQQVLINLMRNAVEAMAGGNRRELEVTTSLLNDEIVEVSVADSGPGLSPGVADHLFEPFVSTKRDGMGLGLCICRSIVEAHGGRLWTRSNPSGGTIFNFTLSAAPAERRSGVC